MSEERERERWCAYCSLLFLGEGALGGAYCSQKVQMLWMTVLWGERWLSCILYNLIGEEIFEKWCTCSKHRRLLYVRHPLVKAMTLYMACCCQKWAYTVHGDAVVAFYPPERGNLQYRRSDHCTEVPVCSYLPGMLFFTLSGELQLMKASLPSGKECECVQGKLFSVNWKESLYNRLV